MLLHEPMTLTTDYALGLLSGALAFRMLGRGPRAARRYWAGALAACAVAAFAGGTYHGFLPWLGRGTAAALWKTTLLAIGCAAYGVTVAAVRAHSGPRWRGPLQAAALLQLGAYGAVALARDEFLVAIIDYSVAFGFVLAVHAGKWLREGDTAARWVAAGVVTSFGGAAIQAAGFAPHPQFNHNDLYHVVQMAGTWMLYRGASRTAEPRG